jgi:hypothetical protein
MAEAGGAVVRGPFDKSEASKRVEVRASPYLLAIEGHHPFPFESVSTAIRIATQ